MRYRLNLDTILLFIDADKEKRTINRIELEGELPLLIADTRHGSATLWMLTENAMSEWGFDAHDYSHEEGNGEYHIWRWSDEDGNLMLRVVIYNPKNSAHDAGQVVVAVGEGRSGEVTVSLTNFLTDFGEWTMFETYGDVEASLRDYGLYLVERKESELDAVRS
jgi:hypothetical protein